MEPGLNPAENPEPIQPVRQAPEVYKFSPEELRVLRQCNIESFYQRCLPIGTFLGLGTFYGVKAGYIGGHARFGATPKVCLAVIAGYFIGKFSYQQKCAEKLMALPNSQVGEILRQRKRQGFSENISLDPGFSAPIGLDAPALPELAPKTSYLDMDSDRPYMGDYHQTPQDDSFDASVIPVPPGGVAATSYDELRKRNRDEFESQRNKPYSYKPLGDSEDVPPVIRARPAPAGPPKPKNRYGDEME